MSIFLRRRTGGTNAKRVRMICLDCQRNYFRERMKGNSAFRGRYTLKHGKYKLERYWRCPNCHGTNVRSDEANRRKENHTRSTCTCRHIPFPHRGGSIVGCETWEGEWDEEAQDRHQSVLDTPRSG